MPSIVSRSPEDTTRVNLYDRLFEQQLNADASALLATETVVEAYLDNKPATRGKQKYTRQQRDSDFWSSDFVNGMPSEAWQAEGPTLALARYLGQEAVANPLLLERIAAASPCLVRRAVRYSDLVLQQHSPRRTELDRIAISNPDIAELCRILDIFDSAYLERKEAVDICKKMLVDLSPFEILIYASLYAFERLNPADFTTPWIPVEERNVTESQWRAINDVLIWKLKTTTQISLRLKEKNLLRSLKMHLSPHLFPSRDGPPPRHDLRAAFKTLLDAQIELNSFISQSADAFSFDDGIEFVRTGERALEIVEKDTSFRAAWERDGRKLEQLHGYWLYRALDEFVHSDLATMTIGLPENHEGNRLAYIRAIRTRLQLTEVYGLDEAVTTDSGVQVDLFQTLLATELMSAFYQRDFLHAFVSHFNETGHWAAALSVLAQGGFATGENRLPLTWSDRKAKIARIIGWTVSKKSPRGNPLMASAILDFWTSDLVTLAARLRQQEHGLRPELFERPVLKLDQLLIQLPWIFGMQNNSTAAINNLRRIGARRADARLETRRIEEQLGRLFESRGFRVVLNWEPVDESDARAGEVDLICALDRIVLVLEVKSTFIRQSQRAAWQHRTTTLRKAGQQLRRKVPAVERALSEGSDLAASLNLAGDADSISIHGWIVDTSIECDHERFSGFLKVSLEEVLIALRDDRHLLNDPDGILSGRYQKDELAIADNAHTEASLYPSGFTVDKFMDAVEKEAVWEALGG
jgi:Holliday junction resolvase-like predicted endonuclease